MILDFNRLLGVCTAAAMLSGCGALPFDSAQGKLAPGDASFVVPGAMPQSQTIAAQSPHTRSWVLPDAKKSELLYVSNFYGNDVLVYSYPAGQPVGMVAGITEAQGECTSRKSNGNWWVVATGANEVLEYAHGGTTPISTLSVTAGQPAACAVDPKTGDLAVTIISGDEVVVYRHGSGAGTTYMAPISPFFCSYDDKGNLFVDGSGEVPLAELPKGGSAFESIALNQAIEFAGGVQWHDNLLAIGDQETSNIYQFIISGSSGMREGTTSLAGGDAAGFWIQKHDVLAPASGDVGIWQYPAGGSPIKTIDSNLYGPIDVVVSVAK
jgi:hypothetical protein